MKRKDGAKAKRPKINELDINKIIEYYEKNSLGKTCGEFHIGPPKLRKILKDNGIEIRDVSKGNVLSHKNKNNKYKETVSVTYEDVYDYYVTQLHSYHDTINHFKSLGIKNFVIEEFLSQIHKTQEQINESKIKTCREKFGCDGASQDPEISHRQEESKLKTLKVKYGETCINSFQLSYKGKYFCDDKLFDSLPELALGKYAKDHNEEIYREPIVLYYRTPDFKVHKYLPDFMYKGKLIEIKGDHLFDRETMLLKNPGNNDLSPEEARRLELKSGLMDGNNVEVGQSDKYNYYVDGFNQHYNKEDYKYRKGD